MVRCGDWYPTAKVIFPGKYGILSGKGLNRAFLISAVGKCKTIALAWTLRYILVVLPLSNWAVVVFVISNFSGV